MSVNENAKGVSQMTKKFLIGTEVVERKDGGGFGPIVKVTKHYKNGNIAIDGSPQQYNPSDHYGTATSTGSRGWTRRTFELVTPELLVHIAAYREFAAARAIVDAEAQRLTNLARNIRFNQNTAEQRAAVLAEAAKIKDRANG